MPFADLVSDRRQEAISSNVVNEKTSMLLPFLHYNDPVGELAASKNSGETRIDCEWVMVERPFSEEVIDIEQLEKYMKESTDPKVIEVANREERGCMQAASRLSTSEYRRPVLFGG